MEKLTLKEFKAKFYPHLTNRDFSKTIGFDNSLVCKIMNGRYECSLGSPRWLELEALCKRYGVELVSTSKYATTEKKLLGAIKNMQYEIHQKDKIIKEYEEVIVELTRAVKVMSNAKSSIKKAEMILTKNQLNK